MSTKLHQKNQVSNVGIYVLIIILAIICVIPLYWMVRSSLMRNIDIYSMDPFIVWPNPMYWSNYTEAMETADFGAYAINTLRIIVLSLVGTLLTSSMAAYAFARLRWRGRAFVFSLILSTMMLPGAVTLIPLYVNWSKLGLIDTIGPLVIPAFFGGGAFNIFLLRQFFLNIPHELDESAKIDGAGPMQIYWRVIIPLSRSALIVVGLFTFLGNWNEFFGPLLYLNTKSKFTLALGLLQFRGDFATKWNLLMAASTIVVVPAILIYLIGQKYLIEGISLTGLKA